MEKIKIMRNLITVQPSAPRDVFCERRSQKTREPLNRKADDVEKI